MTLNPRVNPKKLRPYDLPRKRRRTLIPDAPDSAAIGFLVAAALWLALAGGLGLLAIGIRIIPFTVDFPFGIFDLGFHVDARRVEAAFANAAVYGWLSNAGFAAIAFMTPRLTGRRLALEKLLILAILAWNSALLGGIAALYVFDLGPNAPLTAMLWLFDGGLATGAFIMLVSFALTAASSMRSAYISLWFAAIALLGLLGLLSLNALMGILDWLIGLDDLFEGLASAFIERAVATMWLLGMAYAVLHYVVPRAVAHPLASGGVAILTFLTWLALAPASALGVLVDPSVPFLITVLGEVATMALLVPAGLAVGNLVATMQGRWSVLFGAGAGALATVSLAFLLGSSLLAAIGSLHDIQIQVMNTRWADGVFVWAAFGTCTFAAFALAEHAFPRMLRRAWGAGPLGAAQLWLGFAGATIAGVALIGGGLAEASLQVARTDADAIRAALLPYDGLAFAGAGLVALAGLALLANVFLMYTSAAPVALSAPGEVAPAASH